MTQKKLSPSASFAGIRWPIVVTSGLAAALAVLLYCFKLRSLIGPAVGELPSLSLRSSFAPIIDNPLLIAHKLPAFVLQHMIPNALLASRLAAVVVALASCVLFYILARRWYGQLSGAAATFLFATSSWMLHTGRYAAGYGGLILLVLIMLNLIVWANNASPSGRIGLAFVAVCGLALYTPGGVWFVVAATAICWPALRQHMAAAKPAVRTAAGLVFAALATLLTLACLKNSGIIRQALGLPMHFPDIILFSKQAAAGLTAFVMRGSDTPQVWLSHTPILDVASTALLITGFLFYVHHLRKPRIRLLLTFSVIVLLLIGLNGTAAYSYFVPIMYLIVGSGLSYLLHTWQKVFPHNPLARATALATITLLLLSVVTFHTQRYFVAWRHSPITVRQYQQTSSSSQALPYLIQ